MERINALLAKGPALTAIDVQAISDEILLLPGDQYHERGPWVWEAVALIVNDPDYMGGATLPD